MTKKVVDTRSTLTRALDALSASGHGSAASALAELIHATRSYLVTPPGPPEHIRDKLSAALQRLGELPPPEEIIARRVESYVPDPEAVKTMNSGRPVSLATLAVGETFMMRGSPLLWRKAGTGSRKTADGTGPVLRIAYNASVYPHAEPKPVPMSAAESRTMAPKRLQFCELRISDKFYVREDHSGGVYIKSSASAAERPDGGTTKIGARTHVYRVPYEPAPNLAAEAMRDNPPPTPPAAFVEACAAAVSRELGKAEPPAAPPEPADEPVALVMVRTAVDVHVRDFNRDHPAANYTPADAVGEFACAILGPTGLVSLIASLANSLAHGRRTEVPA